ncbi:FAD binding domain-containing protein [Peziza echinospora]|nr:FAD binding domain-containing protein [Peziza echinospora]
MIKTVPIAAPCFSGAVYDSEKCAEVTEKWSDSFLHDKDPSSIMSPFHQGITCLPLANPMPGPWSVLGYPNYVVQAMSVQDVQQAVNFARMNNIRLVVKNTGHDFSGKSGGANAISVWTHHLKNITYIPEIKTTEYTGKAFKVGSGVQGYEIYQAAAKEGLMVVGGEGMTVGFAGGYLQGGGHSPLSSILGMGADHVLSFDVVTADGSFRTADATTNSDLFWALRGGGGSTFGVVTAVTVKAYPTVPVTTVTFTFTMSDTVTLDQWWSAVRVYLENFPVMADAGMYSYFSMLPGVFNMAPLFAPKLTPAEVNALMKPLYDKLEELGIECNPDTVYHTNFYDAWNYSFAKEIVGWRTIQIGSRLWPRQQWHDTSSFDAMFNAIRGTTDLGRTFLGFNIAPTLANGGNPDNAVNPAWRNTLFHSISVVGWADDTPADVIQTMRDQFTNVEMQSWRDVSPGAGSYLGESDINEPNFQQAFWGTEKYSKLYALKQMYDPEGVFYAATAVGSENWTDKNSERRLCPSYRSSTKFY